MAWEVGCVVGLEDYDLALDKCFTKKSTISLVRSVFSSAWRIVHSMPSLSICSLSFSPKLM